MEVDWQHDVERLRLFERHGTFGERNIAFKARSSIGGGGTDVDRTTLPNVIIIANTMIGMTMPKTMGSRSGQSTGGAVGTRRMMSTGKLHCVTNV
jgi:hypothetical protein